MNDNSRKICFLNMEKLFNFCLNLKQGEITFSSGANISAGTYSKNAVQAE